MKHFITTILVAICGVAGISQAKVITVDNNAGSVAMYSSLQAAINAAATGDTILIAGSPNDYGSVSVGRRLKFVGPGYFLEEHGTPGINKNAASASFYLYRRDLSNASGCTFSGLYANIYPSDPGITGIVVDKCRAGSASDNGYMAVIYSRCWIESSVSLTTLGSTIRNSNLSGGITLRNGATVMNCVLRNFNSANVNTSEGASVSNTIFITSTAVNITKEQFAANCKGSISHCLAVSGPGPSGGPSYLPEGLGNNPTIHLFYDVFTGGVADKAYYLIDDSPAKGTGFNGVDMGVFSGVSPYVIGGLPQIPRITRFVIPSKATSTSGLRIEMDAEAF
jgi:hypothetical protein